MLKRRLYFLSFWNEFRGGVFMKKELVFEKYLMSFMKCFILLEGDTVLHKPLNHP